MTPKRCRFTFNKALRFHFKQCRELSEGWAEFAGYTVQEYLARISYTDGSPFRYGVLIDIDGGTLVVGSANASDAARDVTFDNNADEITVADGATLEARALDAHGAQIGGVLLPSPLRFPVSFEVSCSAIDIDPGTSYALEVNIRAAMGSMLYSTDNPVPVLTLGAPDHDVEVLVD